MNLVSNVAWPDALPLPYVDFDSRPSHSSSLSTIESAAVQRRQRFKHCFNLMGLRWSFTRNQFVAFEDFFETELNLGVSSFSMDVRFPRDSELEAWQMRFQGGYQVKEAGGLKMVSAEMILLRPIELPPISSAYGDFIVVPDSPFYVEPGSLFMVLN